MLRSHRQGCQTVRGVDVTFRVWEAPWANKFVVFIAVTCSPLVLWLPYFSMLHVALNCGAPDPS